MAIEPFMRIISDVLGIAEDVISDEDSPDTIESWDSVTHINLILALECEFNISISPEDSMDMQTVKLIRIILAEQGIA